VRIIQQIKEGKLHIVSDYKGRPPIKEKDSVIEQSRIDALHRDLNEFLQPFGETFTYRHLANIQVPDYRIDGTYGVKTS
jgi:hypothetical protein